VPAPNSDPGPSARSMADRALWQGLWWVCLLVAPAVLIGIELFHPANFTAHPGMYQFLSHPEHGEPQFQALAYFGPGWWFTLHMIQTPTVGLVALGLWLIVEPIRGRDGHAALAFAWLARAAIFVFLIYYTVLDAIGGIGLGQTILMAQALAANGTLNPQQFDGVVQLLDATWTDPWIGGVGSFISHTGSWAVFAATVFAALALLLAREPGWLAIVPLLGFGWELQASHASPHGPVAFVLLIIASGWIWRARRRRGEPQLEGKSERS
jgi:hypothetical protein